MYNLHEPDEAKVFKCNLCSKKFVRQYQLNHHKINHELPPEKKFSCDECGKK